MCRHYKIVKHPGNRKWAVLIYEGEGRSMYLSTWHHTHVYLIARICAFMYRAKPIKESAGK